MAVTVSKNAAEPDAGRTRGEFSPIRNPQSRSGDAQGRSENTQGRSENTQGRSRNTQGRSRNRQGSTGARGADRNLFAGRVVAVLALLLSALVLRTAVTSITPLLGRIGDEVGFGSTVAGVFGMVPTAMFALFGLLTPLFIRRMDLESVVVLAMVLSGAGMLLRALVGDTALLLLFSAVALAGMGIGNVVIPPLVKRYFSDRVALMSAVYITCVQLGTAIPPLVAVPVANAFGWRWSIGMWTLVAVAALLPTTTLLRSRRAVTHRAAAGRAVTHRAAAGREGAGDGSGTGVGQGGGTAEPAPEPAPESARESAQTAVTEEVATAASAGRRGSLMRTTLAWGLAGMFGMTSLITYSLFTWLPEIFTDAGADEAFGGAMVALFSAMGLLAALGGPTLCARMLNPFPVVLACCAVYIAGFAGLYFAPMAAPELWVVLLGLGPSTFPMSLTLINLRTRTQPGASRLSGFSQGVGYTAACLGPILFGVLREATGGWAWPFLFMLGAAAVMALGAFFACRPRFLEDLW